MKTLILLAALAIYTGRIVETCAFLPAHAHHIDRR